MPTLYFDPETGSPRSLHEHGAWAYAACSDTRVWCVCFTVDDREAQSWTPGDPVPDVFTAIAADPTGWEVVAHGIEFDRAIYEHILVARYGFPPLPLDIQHCSMSLARANAYPAELARLCSALEIEYQKDREGALLMRQMARPRKKPKRRERNPLGVRCREACAADHLLRPRHSLLSRRLDRPTSCPSHSV